MHWSGADGFSRSILPGGRSTCSASRDSKSLYVWRTSDLWTSRRRIDKSPGGFFGVACCPISAAFLSWCFNANPWVPPADRSNPFPWWLLTDLCRSKNHGPLQQRDLVFVTTSLSMCLQVCIRPSYGDMVGFLHKHSKHHLLWHLRHHSPDSYLSPNTDCE